MAQRGKGKKKRKRRPSQPRPRGSAAAAAAPQSRAERTEAKNAAVRETLVPLDEGERRRPLDLRLLFKGDRDTGPE